MTFLATLHRYKLHFCGILLLLAGLYWRIVPDMVKDWYRDENYSHGFLVPIIAGYFLWQRWPDLKERVVKPDAWGLVVIVWGLFQLLIGWFGTEYFTMRTSLIVLLAGMALFFFGREVFKGMALPLGYLIFMVPIPYIIYDMVAFPLKLFVTKVSVLTLKAVGVVVMREGNIIMFPATTLEVADACSGIRSLVSLLALAVAFAFFLRITPWKRWILICSAVPIAIFTNSMRVIVTGFLAQYWGEKAAQGFFHEFAGLAVFGLAMVMLVSCGALLTRWERSGKALEAEKRENDETVKSVSDAADKRVLTGRIPAAAFVTVLILFAAVGLYINLHHDLQVPINKSFDQFPVNISGWRMVGESHLSENVQKILKATDVLSRQYANTEGKQVNLYIGYHGGGKGSGGIHSPKHCLPGSGWYEFSTRRTQLDVAGEKVNLVQAVYQKGENKEMFLYWFQARNKTMSEEYSLKIAEITNSMLYRRRDTAFIRVSVPFETDEQAAQLLGERFVREMYPTIRGFLPE